MIKQKRNSTTTEHSTQRNAETDQQPLEHSTKLMALNDDCILKIFEYLPLNDVCNFSQSSRRMHTLGSSHFMRNYQSKVIVFVDTLGCCQPSKMLSTFLATILTTDWSYSLICTKRNTLVALQKACEA